MQNNKFKKLSPNGWNKYKLGYLRNRLQHTSYKQELDLFKEWDWIQTCFLENSLLFSTFLIICRIFVISMATRQLQGEQSVQKTYFFMLLWSERAELCNPPMLQNRVCGMWVRLFPILSSLAFSLLLYSRGRVREGLGTPIWEWLLHKSVCHIFGSISFSLLRQFTGLAVHHFRDSQVRRFTSWQVPQFTGFIDLRAHGSKKWSKNIFPKMSEIDFPGLGTLRLGIWTTYFQFFPILFSIFSTFVWSIFGQSLVIFP